MGTRDMCSDHLSGTWPSFTLNRWLGWASLVLLTHPHRLRTFCLPLVRGGSCRLRIRALVNSSPPTLVGWLLSVGCLSSRTSTSPFADLLSWFPWWGWIPYHPREHLPPAGWVLPVPSDQISLSRHVLPKFGCPTGRYCTYLLSLDR